MHVLALAKYGTRAASTRQRMLQYAPHLAQQGITLEVRSLLNNDYVERLAQGATRRYSGIFSGYGRRVADLVRARNFDVIWLHDEVFPYLPGFVECLLTLTGVPVVYDFDDAVFHHYDQHRSAIFRRVLGQRLVPILKYASACICGNAYLQAYANRYCRNSIVVPTVVDTDLYRPLWRQGTGKGVSKAPTVGWIGSPSTWRYVEPILPVLLPMLAQRGLTLRVVGAGPRARGISGVEAIDWSEENEVADIQAMDIGIMPLPDEPWARGKCGYKLIQYMACGLPVIASPVGVNAEIVSDDENGFLASDDSSWIRSLERLIADPVLRRRFGANGATVIEQRYSLRSQQDRVAAVLTKAAERTL